MRAVTVVPKKPASVSLDEIAVPPPAPDSVLADVVAIGICGTDVEIVRGEYGWAPPGRERLVIGHESLARVVEAPFVVRVDRALGLRGVLLEPASVVAKAWRVTEAAGRRAEWKPRVALVTGAGPIGLLAALLGVQRGLEVHVLDRVTDGPKPELVRRLGAHYHSSSVDDAGPEPDVILECTGVDTVVFAAMDRVRRNGVVCLTGVSSGAHVMSSVNIGKLNRSIVLENNLVVGSVNANRRDYEAGAAALAAADPAWLDGVIARRVPLSRWHEAFEHHAGDVKTILCFDERSLA
jgi:threonine dehydrogenase-like Zn-dependent dehydrogenase